MTEPSVLSLNLQQLLTEHSYLIPMYQRNYAWSNSEIDALIKDMLDAYDRDYSLNYYIGTLVVFKRKDDKLEVIDGQQRLTTLTLLAIFLNKHKNSSCAKYLMDFKEPNLCFESRPHSTATLSALFSNDTTAISQNETLNNSILHGYDVLERIMNRIFNKELSALAVDKFCFFLFNKVKIARLPVPDETDLNHYFEVMNNRGEQLEKHEIIKARLLSIIEKANENNIKTEDKKLAKALIHDVWEACANMNKYVQYGFNTSLRTAIFSEGWNNFTAIDFDELLRRYKQIAKEEAQKKSSQKQNVAKDIIGDTANSSLSLHKILFDKHTVIPPNPKDKNKNKDGDSEIYYSLIDFPNFLLQVLRVHITHYNQDDIDSSLDDKQLLKQFDKYLINPKVVNQTDKIKDFIYTLLKTKFLFDQNIIKRNTEDKKGHWTIERFKKSESSTGYIQDMESGLNSHLVIIQSVFHVSAPAMNYKYWLNACLQYLHVMFNGYQKDFDDEGFLTYIKGLAKSYMLKRYIATIKQDDLGVVTTEYFNNYSPKASHTKPIFTKDIELNSLLYNLNYQNIRSFVFNYLDYLIWYSRIIPDEIRMKFKFTTQSSIEHFLPQNPIHKNVVVDKEIDVHRFGNLCLINSGLNSSVGNKMPLSKKEYFDEDFSKKVNSLKLYKMLETLTSDNNAWGHKQIIEHESEMFGLFEDALGIKIKENNHE
ncbi:DUF262 domain-containing protein [Psychrobacter glacincola]|uniref:GmrSD restriction endonuclease domain-containing protein n=1 Tax=Psychrobacter glacincola TaxID=56810 RepID=UPI0039AFC1EA